MRRFVRGALSRAALLALLLTMVGVAVPGGGRALAAGASPGAPAAAAVAPAESLGYWMATADGTVLHFGDAPAAGSVTGHLNAPVVGMAATPTLQGYWLVAGDGGVLSLGDAAFFGSAGDLRLNQPIVGMATTPAAQGYWLVARDGGIFTYGDGAFFGSTGAMTLNKPIVGMASTPTGHGYWLFASDGGVFSFGDAQFFGSAGDLTLNQPVVGAATTPTGKGYWLVARDGGIFTYGDAAFLGSTGGLALNQPIVGMTATEKGDGYTLAAADGGAFTFGTAPFLGAASTAFGAAAVTSASGATLASPVVAIAPFDRYADVRVIGFNDFHGNLEPPAGANGTINGVTSGGLEFMATYVEQQMAANPDSIVVSAGDLIGASPTVSGLFHDEPTVEAWNKIGLSLDAVGNHEFDEGTAELQRMQNGGCHPTDGCLDGDGFPGATFQLLAANVVDKTSGNPMFPAYAVRSWQGARVAFIGMTLKGTPELVSPAGISSVDFKGEAETVNAIVPQLKAMGIKSIVVLLHEGGTPDAGSDVNACANVTGPIVGIATAMSSDVDVIMSGHTHQAYNCVIAGKVVTSAASFGRLVTDVDLRIDKTTGDVIAVTANNVVVTRDVAKDAWVTSWIDKYKALAAPLANRVVGSASVDIKRDPSRLSESAMGDFVTDAMREYYAGVDGAITNSGGLRADLMMSPPSASEAVGEITWGELFAVLPFGNRTVIETLTGAQLEAAFVNGFKPACGDTAGGTGRTPQISGLKVTFHCDSSTTPAHAVIDGMWKAPDGPTGTLTAIAAADTVRVVTNDFMYTGGDGYTALSGGTSVAQPGDDLLDLVVAYLGVHSPVAPAVEGRMTKGATT
ncbi:MAG TPA: bifunctional metallophosphatase/5'-nucleotidase [Acidimicrobiales bacterium]|nr:bifunctional metallophosphatase/5'-nucleotidase [Acidimicrobiales bacterium]